MKTTWFALGLALGSLVACGDKDGDTGGATGDGGGELVGDATAGAAVYTPSCSGCHGADGSGGSGPSLFEGVPGKTDAELTDIIQNGKDDMPAIGTSGQDLADLLAYLGASFGA